MTNYFKKYRYFKGNILDNNSEINHNVRTFPFKIL